MKLFNYLILLSVIIILQGCGSTSQKKGQSQQNHQMAHGNMESKDGHDHHDHQAMPSAEPSGMSLYNVDAQWTTQNDEQIRLKSLQGKVQVVSMVYASCQYACPRIIEDMKKIKETIPDSYREDVNYVLITFDPENDTPAKLRQFANEKDLENGKWLLLNGSRGDIREMAALLGITYKRVNEIDFNHSNIITVLDQKGEIVHRQKGLGQNPSFSVDKIKDLFN